MLLIQNVSKRYQLGARPLARLGRRRDGGTREFWALRNVNCRIEKGEFFGIVGPNGSGKSTLLQIVAGVLTPTEGRVVCNGRLAALLELGAGFNPDFTGRENVCLNGEILGLSRAEITARLQAIEDFAGIGDYIDRPVKEYSSGMYVRLAFSSAIHVEPEVLVVDEALAVGDAIFANRCIRKFEELRARGVTVILVSHDLGVVKRLCDRALLLWQGNVEILGEPSEVVNRYVGLVLQREEREDPAPSPTAHRHGDRTSIIEKVELLDGAGNPATAIRAGDSVTIRVRARFCRPAPGASMCGILIRNRNGVEVFGTNTRIEGVVLPATETLTIEFQLPCLLAGGEYTLTPAMQHEDGTSQDWLDDAISFEVVNERQLAGVASLPVTISVNSNSK